MDTQNSYYATGRRKNAIARTWLKPGKGRITVNNKTADEYFSIESTRSFIREPLVMANVTDSFDIMVTVKGGGVTGQAGAVRHGITRALIESNPDLRQTLKRAGFVKRDPRAKERKKYGQRGARARFQFSKR